LHLLVEFRSIKSSCWGNFPLCLGLQRFWIYC